MVGFLGAGGLRGGSGGRDGIGGRGGTMGAGGLLCLAPPVDVLPCRFGGRGGIRGVSALGGGGLAGMRIRDP